MLRMLEAQAPAKQTATQTIDTLSSRLNDATLLEDRRAAILGLRSFAKEYPASVASGSLRGLIGCLTKDLDDVDTTKVVLETLLMLFSPNVDSLEASEDITLWLADEFTQRQDNIEALLQLLEAPDFYPRLYSLNLITAINAARPERTQDCILNAPLGSSRLAGTLDDARDAVRNAGLMLLGDLTANNTDLQKLIAFEDAFVRIFSIIKTEGGVTEGSVVVQDCLEVLANLVRYNPSNQSLFRESGCALQVSQLLGESEKPKGEEDTESWPNPQREKNLWGLLGVLRLFLAQGSAGTPANQTVFVRHGVLQRTLFVAFAPATPPLVRAEALQVCADLIRGNADIQANFAQSQVAVHAHPASVNGQNGHVKNAQTSYVIDALLDLILAPPPNTPFEVRIAACECIKAYFHSHARIKTHFLQRAIEGHMEGEDETPNVLTTLLQAGPAARNISDPHRIWFAAVIVFHLILNDVDAKHALMAVSEGDAESGEEVITFIQGLSANLISCLQGEEDERVVFAYFTLLSGLLHEDAAAVNDFLSEGSTIQVLMQTAKINSSRKTMVKGLCAVVLGLLYEFSTRDSPIPRGKLHDFLNSGLGRELFLQNLEKLRQHPLVRDYEVTNIEGGAVGADYDLPSHAYLDQAFVEYLKDNFSLLRRSIDRDPGLESHIALGHQGVERDVVDSLRSELEEKQSNLQKLTSSVVDLESRLELEQAQNRKTQETTLADLSKLRHINEALQREHEAELLTMKKAHEVSRQQQDATSAKKMQDLEGQLRKVTKESTDKAERTKDYYERSIGQLRTAKKDLEARTADIKRQHEESMAAVQSAKNRETRLKDESESMKKQMSHKQSAFEEVEAELKTKSAKLVELSGVEKENQALREEIEKREAAAATLENELRAKTTKMNELQKAGDESKTLGKRLAEAQSTIEQLQANIANQTQQIGVIEAMRKERDAVTSQLDARNTAYKSLESRLKEQIGKVVALEKSKTSAEENAEDDRTKVTMLEKEVSDLTSQIKRFESRLEHSDKALKASQASLKTEENGRSSVQTELDDLLLVFSDLEEKHTKNKKRLKALGEDVSDIEEEDDDEDDDEEDEDGEDRDD